jgi:hypothetical protein
MYLKNLSFAQSPEGCPPTPQIQELSIQNHLESTIQCLEDNKVYQLWAAAKIT